MQGRYTWRVAIWGKIQDPVVSWYPHTTWYNSECSVYWYWGSAVVPVYFSPLSWCRCYFNFAPNVLWTVSPKVLTNVQIFPSKYLKATTKGICKVTLFLCDVQKLPHKTGQKFSKNWRKVLKSSPKKRPKVLQKVGKSFPKSTQKFLYNCLKVLQKLPKSCLKVLKPGSKILQKLPKCSKTGRNFWKSS